LNISPSNPSDKYYVAVPRILICKYIYSRFKSITRFSIDGSTSSRNVLLGSGAGSRGSRRFFRAVLGLRCKGQRQILLAYSKLQFCIGLNGSELNACICPFEGTVTEHPPWYLWDGLGGPPTAQLQRGKQIDLQGKEYLI
jgi:hypothetical protein